MSVQDHAVFDFSSKVVDYRIIKTSTGDAGSLVVLCEEELVVIDLVTPKWPSYRKCSSFILREFQFRWLKIKGIHAALPISITLFSNHLK